MATIGPVSASRPNNGGPSALTAAAAAAPPLADPDAAAATDWVKFVADKDPDACVTSG